MSFAFYFDWFDIYRFLDINLLLTASDEKVWARPGKEGFRYPAICYLEYLGVISSMAIIALLDLLRPRVAECFKKKQILFLTDNQAALPWELKARCSFFPWWRCSKIQLTAELVLDSKFHFAYVSTDFQKADPLTRGCEVFSVGGKEQSARRLPTKACQFLAGILDGSRDFQQLFAQFALDDILRSQRKLVQGKTPNFFFSLLPWTKEGTTRGLDYTVPFD